MVRILYLAPGPSNLPRSNDKKNMLEYNDEQWQTTLTSMRVTKLITQTAKRVSLDL